jgi:hypothetical protein
MMLPRSRAEMNARQVQREVKDSFLELNQKLRMLIVPPNTNGAVCRDCCRVVYPIVLDSGKLVQVDCDVIGGQHPSSNERGFGKSHVASCPARQAGRHYRDQERRR